MRRVRMAVACALAVFGTACDDASAEGESYADEMPDDFPADNCRATGGDTDGCDTDGTSSTTAEGGVDGECLVEGCIGQSVCVAPWDAESQTRGEFECRFACIPLVDETSWCSDGASCCDAAARCTDRGYCVLEDEGTGSGSSGDGSTGGGDTSTGGGA